MLYPKENKETDRLEFACRTCAWKEEATSSCVFRNEFTNTVGETAGITTEVGQDPTVGGSSLPSSSMPASSAQPPPPMPEFCTLCGGEILCEFCGQESDRGMWLEVDENATDDIESMPYSPPITDPESIDEDYEMYDDVDDEPETPQESTQHDPLERPHAGSTALATDSQQEGEAGLPHR